MYQIPTAQEAIEYVIASETSWGETPRVVSTYIDHENEFRVVVTTEREWSVWFDGIAIYGEA
jgi:hypothetical protein